MEMESRVEKDMPCESTQNLEDSLLFSTREQELGKLHGCGCCGM